MKHEKKPTKHQAKFIGESGFDSREWLVVKDTSKEMHIVSKHGGSLVITLYK